MSELSRDEVVEILGPVGDAMAAEIIATGISRRAWSRARSRGRDRKAHNGRGTDPGASPGWSTSEPRTGVWARAARRSNEQAVDGVDPAQLPPDILCQVKTRRGFSGWPIYATQRCCPRAIATTGTSAVVSADASTV
jgi:hypothetical protein